jgi:hypothetical protein
MARLQGQACIIDDKKGGSGSLFPLSHQFLDNLFLRVNLALLIGNLLSQAIRNPLQGRLHRATSPKLKQKLPQSLLLLPILLSLGRLNKGLQMLDIAFKALVLEGELV